MEEEEDDDCILLDESEEVDNGDKVYMAGIDEVARGCVLGPMVICCYLISTDKEPRLRALKVKDSKSYKGDSGRRTRARVGIQLLELADQVIIKEISAQDISKRGEGELNKIEYELFLDAIKDIKLRLLPDRIVIDACGSPIKIQTIFSNHLLALKHKGFRPPTIIAESKADKNYPVVSAASIVAKEYREQWISVMNEAGHKFGSGYPGDEKTIQWLTARYKKDGKFPEITRLYWGTCDKIVNAVNKVKVKKVVKKHVDDNDPDALFGGISNILKELSVGAEEEGEETQD
jgi:ribonuclease HII